MKKDLRVRTVALRTAGEEIVELRRVNQLLSDENARLRLQLEDELAFTEEVRLRYPTDSTFSTHPSSLSNEDLTLRLHSAIADARAAKHNASELQTRLERAYDQAIRHREVESKLDEVEQACIEQAQTLERSRAEIKKLSLYRDTAKTQEKVIGKLEKVVEGSIADLQRAQVQHSALEKMRRENEELRSSEAEADAAFREAEELLAVVRKQNAGKDVEIEKLELRLQRGSSRSPRRGNSPRADNKGVATDRERLLEYKVEQLQRRIETSEDSIREGGRGQNKELAQLRVLLAKREAQIRELGGTVY